MKPSFDCKKQQCIIDSVGITREWEAVSQHVSPRVDHEALSRLDISRVIELCQHDSNQLACAQKLSNIFLGRPYLIAACGEGPAGDVDQAPVYRTDGFDCVTWVNTVLAVLQARDITAFEQAVIAMNYQNSELRYTSRCHIMSTQWNPWNESRGVLQSITEGLAKQLGADLQITEALIHYPAWLRARSLRDVRLRSLKSASDARDRLHALYDQANGFHPKRVRLSYLPLSALTTYAASGKPWQAVLPELCVVQWVRTDWQIAPMIGTDLHVMHVGFLMRDADEVMFCHASWGRGIVTDSLQTMLDTCERLGVAGFYVQGITAKFHGEQ